MPDQPNWVLGAYLDAASESASRDGEPVPLPDEVTDMLLDRMLSRMRPEDRERLRPEAERIAHSLAVSATDIIPRVKR